MKEFIESWLKDQVEDYSDQWDFQDNFDSEKATEALFQEFDCSPIYDQLENLLTDYLH